MNHVGVMGIGTYIPETRMDASEIALKSGIPEDIIREKFGVESKPIPGPDDTTSYMGIEAAKKAIENAGISSKEIDIVIWNGAQHKDYLNWLAGLHVAEQIGAVNAWSFDMEAMCGSMMAGIEVARSLMIANDNYRTVLLVSGYRNGDMIDYSISETSFMFDIGAGGAAMVLRKNLGRNEVLSSSFRGDGSFSLDCVVKVGGSRSWPVRSEDVDKFHFHIDDIAGFKKKLGERTLPNFFTVIRDSLAKASLTQDDIDYLAILHFKRSTHDIILSTLNLKENQTTYLKEYGHIGQNDQIISIQEGLEGGKIKDGSIIVMVGAGIGFVWAAAVLRWGPV